MWFLIGVIILILFILVVYLIITYKVKKYFHKSIFEIISDAKKEDEQIPKSLSSMDSIYLEGIRKDFPDLNINELKRKAEQIILDSLSAIEKKNTSKIKEEKVKSYVESVINDLKGQNINYDSIKIHNTVISKYEKTKSIATIYISTALEYLYLKNNKLECKVQDRYKLEFVYVIDEENVEKDKKLIGLNCPNCGAPIKTTKNQKCPYCKTEVITLPKRVWVCNDILRY